MEIEGGSLVEESLVFCSTRRAMTGGKIDFPIIHTDSKLLRAFKSISGIVAYSTAEGQDHAKNRSCLKFRVVSFHGCSFLV